MFPTAYTYFQNIVQDFDLDIIIVKKRKTKFGDFRPKINSNSIITVNEELEKDVFAIIFSHELAHYMTFKKYGRSVKPHGSQWKSNFTSMLIQMIHFHAFENQEFVDIAKNIISNPKAVVSRNDLLYKKIFNISAINKNSYLTLNDIQKGDKFVIAGRTSIFEKKEKRRVRYICKCLCNSRYYLIHECTEIEKIPNAI
jgi:SprT protein